MNTPDRTQMYEFWKEWFAQPAEAKEPFLRKRDPETGKGSGIWFPPFTEAPGYGKADPKEYIHWKISDAPLGGHATKGVFWDCYSAGRIWLGHNGFKKLLNAIRPDDCVLRIIRYPPTADVIVGEAHRDYDLLTVNVGGTCPGLEVYDPEERHPDWHTPGVPGGWIAREGGIHAGEMLEIYAENKHVGDCRVATTHRVCVSPNTERFAAVFFMLPPMDFELRPGFTAKDYLLAKPGEREDGWVGVLNRASPGAAVK